MRLPDYPFTGQRFEVRPGIAMHYLDEGPRDGEVVVMLHGNPSWSYYWRQLVLGLRGRYRCIVPDQPGSGGSPVRKSTYPLKLSMSVKAAAARLAKADGVSLSQFIAAAVAEKIGVLNATDAFLRQRAGDAKPADLKRYLGKDGDEAPRATGPEWCPRPPQLSKAH